ncbi:condensation domain-containing protein, partial [Actinophytocola sp.]|uniref:condensation domain-containing protein n=1 Tax=Actinophytocola sp. TaxID=1872138 RepID=UPI002D7FCCAC
PPDTATPPGDPTLRAVTEIFGAVLGRTAVPPDVPFFALGGSSLAAGRACARLAARLDRPVPVAQLYRHPTAAALARWLDTTIAVPSPAAPPTEIPLTPMQLVYLTRWLVDPADRTGHCLLTWVIEGSLDRAALAAAVAAVHRRHEPLRAAYRPDPAPQAQVVAVPAPVPVVLDPAPSVDDALAALRAELAGDLDPTTGRVWRTALAPAGQATVFGVAVHHIAFDGASEAVLARDLAAAYAGAMLPPAPALHAVRRQHAEPPDALRGELTGVPELRWPADPLDPAPDEPCRVEVRVGPEVLRAVDALAAAAGVTRFTVLLAQYAASLADVTGQRDFAVGVPVAQRGAGLEDAIGCHLNMVCLRLRGSALDGDPAAVGSVVARAFATQDVPLRDVLELVAAPRTGRPPLFQTLFALQDNEIPRMELPGLDTSFHRAPYLDLPLELHTELWPEDGGLRVEVAFRPDAVGRTTAEALVKLLIDRLHTIPTGERR